ncbi:SCP2 sterol-binding domain-containing protein [Micromonospora sp. CPCC 206060]|uniref:SCP2 sterol-binding domain-containing protein n=1 Tax=Micromonospora sp. CPCC 206060 TaxID=3122406 RepID=UPI002FF11E9D
MADPIAEFFAGVVHHRYDRLKQVAGTIRFDLERDQHTTSWLMTIERGDVSVSRKSRRADCTVRLDEALFARIVRGEANVYAAWLRNEIKLVGRLYMLDLFQRVLPGPPGARDPRPVARRGELRR